MKPHSPLKSSLNWVLSIFAIVISMFVSAQPICADDNLTPDELKFFETKIRPVLVRECYGCHSTQVGQLKGGLWLDNKDGVMMGGDSGPAVTPGDLDESLLFSAINHQDYRMPPGKKLPVNVIDDFRQWIEMGAPDPRINKVGSIRSAITKEDIETGKQFWSFVKPKYSPVPVSTSDNFAQWADSDIDRYILDRLESNDLEPSSDADATTVLRRLTFDLVGLPPTPKQIDEFGEEWKQDPQAAVEKITDRLLASPQFGERWARHWLDTARYAESSGKELNLTFPHAWRYRDYVIDSFNGDKPYDRFVQEQIAGDLMPVKTDEQWSKNLVATGFLAMGPKTLTEQNARQFELDLIDEQIDVTTRVMLGVSVACARCHDHKFDPIPQEDYYALSGIFRSMTTHYGTLDNFQNRRPTNLLILPVEDLSSFDKKISRNELTELKSQLAEKEEELRDYQRQRRLRRKGTGNSEDQADIQKKIASAFRSSAQVGILKSKINAYDDQGNPLSFCMGVQSTDQPFNARLLERGEFDKVAQEVERGFPQVLCDAPARIDSDSTGRLEFARWVGSDDNPLTARVMANRVWQHLLGQALVRTPDNFGATGQPSTHPELLDYLAVEFVKNDWSVKQLVRSIVTSRIYRTSSEFNEASFESDPENKLLWRVEPKRLDAESLRDSILAISGGLEHDRPRATLVAEIGASIVRDGSLFSTLAPSGMQSSNMQNSSMQGRRNRMSSSSQMNRGASYSGGQSFRPGSKTIDQPSNRRSICLPIVRDNLPRSLEVFDFPEPSLVSTARETSNTPDQGLYFLNNQFVIDQSELMAKRLVGEFDRVKDQLENAYLLAYGRKATSAELRAAASFYRKFQPSSSSREIGLRKLSAVCQGILASAEFRFLN